MLKLEQLEKDQRINGLVPGQTVQLIAVKRSGQSAVQVAYRLANGETREVLLYRHNENRLSLPAAQPLWPFDGDGQKLRLVSEAYRIRLGHLFDPRLAVHTSLIDPLPHQIMAVYEEMLPRQPLRFLLADDPGAGKTIMAGLLIRELIARGDVRRCLICAPGNLTEQWQDELSSKFHLGFTIFSHDLLEASRSGNPFAEQNQLIIRLDQISRNAELQNRLKQTDWDLIVCDEAHKMSATYFGNDLRKTKRYQLGELLGGLTRHLLLMTATPHNGKEEDFELFMKLLDADRFEGRAGEKERRGDVSDMMRRMVKERLLTFEGKRLFPERRARTVNYDLSPAEKDLYESVTEYVCNEFNKAEKLEHGGQRSAIGFALTLLQRRLASSPAAIYHSLRRRRERLEAELKEAQAASDRQLLQKVPVYSADYLDQLDDAPASEAAKVVADLDGLSAARSPAELASELNSLRVLEAQAQRIRRRRTDRKWNQLLELLQDSPELKNAAGRRRKLIIFTEHRDTLNYLTERLSAALGRPDAIVAIYGGLPRKQRRAIEERFRHDSDVEILVATDAAGEGINLQNAHLMVNYDLPWNPNRLEQRFGRIHRIGQTEVCHMWNLVAAETREGAVYQRLLEKLATAHDTLNGQVFDVLGQLFSETPLRQLLMEAVRYGDDPTVRAQLSLKIENATDQKNVQKIVRDDLLIQGVMDTSLVEDIRAEMERAHARRLQPHFIKAFFAEAFQALGGSLHPREGGRFIINNVPASLRQHAAASGSGPIARKYSRICFDKSQIHHPNKPDAAFVCPGHPLLDAAIDLTLTRGGAVLKQGAVLIDPADLNTRPRALFYLEGKIHDALPRRAAERSVISRELHFVEIDSAGELREAGPAPYLDYRPPDAEEWQRCQAWLAADWLKGERLENLAKDYAIEHLIPRHLERVSGPRQGLINKTEAAVKKRLTQAINYWDQRAIQLRVQEEAGKFHAQLNSRNARQRAADLAERLQQRLENLALERQISAAPPAIVGGALIIPLGLLSAKPGDKALDTRPSELSAMQAVMAAEIALGNQPKDISRERRGYDIESYSASDNEWRFIEVKGRRKGAPDITLTRNELLCALNKPEQFILAIVEIEGDEAAAPRYVRGFPFQAPANYVTSLNVKLSELLADSTAPR